MLATGVRRKVGVLQDMADAKKPELDIFGDESCRGRWIVFGALAVRSSAVAEFECRLAHLKTEFGGHGDDELHCRVMFPGDQRNKKSAWAHLSKTDVFSLYERVVHLTRDTSSRRLIAYADRNELPKVIPKDDWAPEMKFGEKEVAAYCGNAIMIPFAKDPGLEKVRYWADPDRTKIDWLGKRRQAKNALNFFLEDCGRVSPESITDDKPRLLEIADLIAYISARVLAGTKSDFAVFKHLFDILEPEQIRFGRSHDGGLGVSVPNTSLADSNS
jgi:hypothetical protein